MTRRRAGRAISTGRSTAWCWCCSAFRGPSLVVMNSDGSDPHAILTMPDYTFIGSPKWSHDGRKIVFDGWRSVMGEGTGDAHVLVVNADGSGVKDLGPGGMPGWSPDDKQITFCRYNDERGVFVMNADGSNARQIDAEGWGSQWSPKRDEIAYTVYGQNGAKLCIYDLAKQERRELEHKAYGQIYWGISWSPEGDRICFKGVVHDGNNGNGANEIAAISVKGENGGFKVLLPSAAKPEANNSCMTVSWGVNKQILRACRRRATACRSSTFSTPTASNRPVCLPTFRPRGYATTWPGRATERRL